MLQSQTFSQQSNTSETLLDVRNLRVSFNTPSGLVTVVHDISLTIKRGETLCIIGESGSGKSVTGLAIAGLLPAHRKIGGEILLDGSDLLKKSEPQMRRLRGKQIGLIFQDAMGALDPVYSIGYQIVETMMTHESIGRRAAWAAATEMLDLVGIPDPVQRMHAYPHELSGGMKQRAVIASALICQPSLLIADEPTTALDVTIQAQIIALLRRLQKKMGMAMMFVTHDLGIVAELADRVAVVYAGRIVETAGVHDLYRRPSMPYTRSLIDLAPHIGTSPRADGRLPAIPGAVPDPRDMPQGCSFSPRCSYRADQCHDAVPPLMEIASGHSIRCARSSDLAHVTGAANVHA